MKYTQENFLENFFDKLEPNELDEIMPENFDAKLSKRSLKRIENTALQKSEIKANKRYSVLKVFAPAAACLVLTAGIGGFAIAAEANEYNAAVDFFEQNGLSAEGLSREELKAVYRDITTNRFTNDKTAEVIRQSVPGVEILQDNPTPEEVAVIWNSNFSNRYQPHNDVEYHWDYIYKDGPYYDRYGELIDNHNDRYLEKITVQCLREDELLWETDFPSPFKYEDEDPYYGDSFYVESCVNTSLGTVVTGNRNDWTGVYENYTRGWLSLVDNDSGSKLWLRELDHGFKHEYIKAVIDNGNGTLAVISCGDFGYLCLSQYDREGNELSFAKTDFGHISQVLNAARLGDGYLVQLACTDGGLARLAKLDKEGNVTDNFVYKSEDSDYYITDMVEFEGRVYLSAYSVPKQTDEGGRNEIADILDYVYSKENWVISSEELTPIVRDNYTAVLLLCDPEVGEPKNFYSVKGSLGGALAVENDQLVWDVESITSTFFSPYTNSFTIGGSCLVYRYSFNCSGILTGCENTGKFAAYNR